jgi:DNA polymerase IV
LTPLLMKLTEKVCSRMRKAGYEAKGVHLAILFDDGDFWHKGRNSDERLFDTRDVYRKVYKLLRQCPYHKRVRNLAVSCYDLEKTENDQLVLFEDVLKKKKLAMAIDQINERWGEYVITPALMMGLSEKIIDRIAFGSVDDVAEMLG